MQACGGMSCYYLPKQWGQWETSPLSGKLPALTFSCASLPVFPTPKLALYTTWLPHGGSPPCLHSAIPAKSLCKSYGARAPSTRSPLPMGALAKLLHLSWAAILPLLWSPGLWRFSHSTPSVSITHKSHQASYLQSLEQVAHTTWGGRADPLSTERHISKFYLQIFYIAFILTSIHECFVIYFELTFSEHLLCAESHCI